MKAYLLTLAALLGGVGLPAAAQQPAPVVPETTGQQVVVLRNGSSLQGEVYPLGDYYRVRTATTEVRLAARDVERVAPTLVDAYDARRAERKVWTADDHLRMAAWCIRQELWPQAAREINDARVMEPSHGALQLFEHRLKMAAEAAERRAQGVTPEPVEKVLASDNAEKQEMAELGQLAEGLPPGALEEFTRNVQPLLVNNCTLAGCHSMNDERSFRLNRDVVHGMGNRRSTLRNLKAVMEAIDAETIDASPLLVMSGKAHGGMVQPAFTGHREKLHGRLVEWARKATGQAVEPATAELPAEGQALPDGAVVPATREEGADLPPVEEDLHFWETDGAGQKIKGETQRGAQLKPFTPRDEFDPEIFNRQQGTQDAAPTPRQAPGVEVER